MTPLQFRLTTAEEFLSVVPCCETMPEDGWVYQSDSERVVVKTFMPFRSDAVEFRMGDLQNW
jgi:hypothetical protein